ncbi:DUF4919 domain-containing protein [Microbulbifer sp. TYP-18]|uniref:DUF4919 domain-containing protein n=1 Tax=Microbulbifer sp. TYP-18 TaxID=3230024 RepID=UPI0034C6DDC2
MVRPKRRSSILAGAMLSTGLLLAACSSNPLRTATGAEQSPAAPVHVSEYHRLLSEAQRLSFTLNFDQLRRAYAQSTEYNPYGGVRLEGLPEAYKAVEDGDYDACLNYVDQVLSGNFMSLEAHMIGVVCSGRAADLQREDRHRYMVDGLMGSIEASGDGRSENSAYRTITTSELRGFVRLKGLQVLDRSIVYDQYGIYDKMQVRDPESGEEYALFFDVTEQLAYSTGDVQR